MPVCVVLMGAGVSELSLLNASCAVVIIYCVCFLEEKVFLMIGNCQN